MIGVSGGLDSTLALLATVRTFDRLQLPRTGIIGITMPGFGTTDRTYQNALAMMELLGISQREINIKDACIQHFRATDVGEALGQGCYLCVEYLVAVCIEQVALWHEG